MFIQVKCNGKKLICKTPGDEGKPERIILLNQSSKVMNLKYKEIVRKAKEFSKAESHIPESIQKPFHRVRRLFL